jgi:hypothetical protein
VTDWIQAHKTWFAWLAVLSAVTLAASALLIPWIIVRVPTDYFVRAQERSPWSDRHPVVRILILVAKNLLGLIVVGLGVLMLILPGQGILTIIAGLALIDFPGRDRFVRWLALREPVMKSLNWIRKRAHREPFETSVDR